jgi:uncharacterized protein YbaA (DUF1428 family)
MAYIDGFVLAVPDANKAAFVEHARQADAVFVECGARRVLECWGDDVPAGKVTDFRRAVQAAQGETVVFSWIEWPDKATRDAGMAKAMQDPRLAHADFKSILDGQRMIFGGLEPVVDIAGA